MTGLKLTGVSKSFGTTRVLDAIEVQVPKGSLCVVVGPSGCGKSTLLRLVAGLDAPDTGHIAIAGRDVTDLAAGQRRVAMVFQNYALLPHLDVARNISLGMEIRGERKTETARRVAEVARLLQLEAHLGKKPRALSGGQRQRVAMGRAIVREPDLFLFDEPLSNLDAQLRAEMRVEIRALQQRLGTTALYVTHDQVEAMTMGDVMVVLNSGRIEQIGAPLDVYARPATVFVARFVGSPAMNILPADVRQGRLVSALGMLATDLPDGPVSLGIRPQDFALSVPDASPAMVIDIIEPHGADTFLHGRIAGQPLIVRTPGARELRPNERVGLTVDPSQLHLFARDGRRLDRVLGNCGAGRQEPANRANEALLAAGA